MDRMFVPDMYAVYAILVAIAVVMVYVCVVWASLIITTRISQKHLPMMNSRIIESSQRPMVSIIVPAKDEELDIGTCIKTLLAQNYGNYEIILVDDDSDDITYDIMESFAKKYDKITLIHTKKPDGWLGKTWACTKAAEKASGKIFLFTDADTEHAPDTLSRTVSYMAEEKLDCLTLTQRLRIPEMWVKITIPAIISFKLVYPDGIIHYSSKSINDPDNQMGGVNGAYFMIKKDVYDSIRGFETLKNEIVEDWAIGRLIKNSGYRLRLVNGSDLVSALWARDLLTLDDLFRRLMLPFVRNDRTKAIWNCLKLLAILFVPYPTVLVSLPIYLAMPQDSLLSELLLAVSVTSIAASLLHTISYGIQVKASGIRLRNVCYASVGGLVAAIGFLDGAKAKGTNWRNRDISPNDVKS